MAEKFTLTTKGAIVNVYDDMGNHHIMWIHPHDQNKVIVYEDIPGNWPDIYLYVEDVKEYLESVSTVDWVKNQWDEEDIKYFSEVTGIPIEEVKAKLKVEGI